MKLKKTHCTTGVINKEKRCEVSNTFSFQVANRMFTKAGNYHHNHSSEMTRLQDGQDETKEKKFKPNGQTIKSPYFSGTLSAAILKKPLQGD